MMRKARPITNSTRAFALLKPADPRGFAKELHYVRMWPGKVGEVYGDHFEARDGSRVFIGAGKHAGFVHYVQRRWLDDEDRQEADATTAEDFFSMLEVAEGDTYVTISTAIDVLDPVHREFFAAA